MSLHPHRRISHHLRSLVRGIHLESTTVAASGPASASSPRLPSRSPRRPSNKILWRSLSGHLGSSVLHTLPWSPLLSSTLRLACDRAHRLPSPPPAPVHLHCVQLHTSAQLGAPPPPPRSRQHRNPHLVNIVDPYEQENDDFDDRFRSAILESKALFQNDDQLNNNNNHNHNQQHVQEPDQEQPLRNEASATNASSTTTTTLSTPEAVEAAALQQTELRHPTDDPIAIFNTVISKLEREFDYMTFPREIIWLNGAPGAGKGTQTPFILKVRGLSSKPIEMSILLKNPEFQSYKDTGDMIPDRYVIEALFRELLKPENSQGVLVDGFPRTHLQVDILKLLYNYMSQLRRDCNNDIDLLHKHPKPRFFITILYVSEQESINRQLKRGQEAIRHNLRVRETNSGKLLPVRHTDMDIELVKKRYKIFQMHRDTLLMLRDRFPFTVIDTEDDIEHVQERIMQEFRYQSSQELRQETFDIIQRIPVAEKIREDARPELVMRLDDYQRIEPDRFEEAVHAVRNLFVPQIKRSAFAGSAVVRMPNTGNWKDKHFIDICLDVLAERGYQCRYDVKSMVLPLRVDPKTFKIEYEIDQLHMFFIQFPEASLHTNLEYTK